MSRPTLTPRRLNRATLARQLLLERARTTVVDAVARVAALQAQEPASPYLALWNRLDPFDPTELDAAFAEGAVVKAPLMRITLHAVTADDYPTLHRAVRRTLRAARLGDPRFTSTGLDAADADRLIPHLVAAAEAPRTRPELESVMATVLGRPPEPGVWWALRTVAPLLHAPTGGAWSFGRTPAFVAPRRPPGPDTVASDTEHGPAEDAGHEPAAVAALVVRYLRAFGPATVQDVARFALLRRTSLDPAIERVRDALVEHEGPGGTRLLDVPEAPLPDDDTPAPPRLMAMWDSALLAYVDRTRVVPEGYRPHVIRRNGDVLPTVWVDGAVVGTWRPVATGVEVTAFEPLGRVAWDGLAEEADRLGRFLSGREPTVYGRYGHWWASLPAQEVRVLPAGS